MKFFAVLLLLALPAVAQDANKMLEQAKKLEAKAEKLLDQGKRAEAFDTLAKATALREKAKNPRAADAVEAEGIRLTGIVGSTHAECKKLMEPMRGKDWTEGRIKDLLAGVKLIHHQHGYLDASVLLTQMRPVVVAVVPGSRYRIKSPGMIVELGPMQDDKLGTQLRGLLKKLDGKSYQSSEVTKISRQMGRVLRKGGFKNAQIELSSNVDGSAKTIGLVFRAHSGAGKNSKKKSLPTGLRAGRVDPAEIAHTELDLALKAGNVQMARKASDKLRKARAAQARRISALEKQLRGLERQLAEIRRMLDIEKPG